MVTAGGIVGRITKVDAGEDTVTVEIAPDVQVKVVRQTIADVLDKKPQPANEASPAQGGGSGGLLGKLFGGGRKS
ncbi:hypothetical protein HRbin39_00575 [bacterium HR39]|nr:hypothetical protein HRbin39_00575 [bacterium HR39]